MPQATSLAAAVQETLGLIAELVPGGGGIFDVEFDHRIVFSKFAEGDRFPEADELIKLLREHMA